LNIFKTTRTDFYLLGAVALLSVIVRVAYYSVVGDEFWFLHPMVDSLNYDRWANDIASGNFLGDDIFKHGPLYPYFLAFLYFIFGASVKNVIISQFILSAAGSVLLYFLGRELFSRKTAFIAAVISCIYGPSLFFESNLLSATFINFINVCLLLILYAAIRYKKYTYWTVAGFIWGLAILTRPNVLLLGFFLFVFVWYYQKKDRTVKHILISATLLFSAALVAVSPSIIRNKVVLDEFLITNSTGGINFYLGNHRNADGYHDNVGELGLKAGNQLRAARELAIISTQKDLSYGESSKYWFRRAIEDISEDPLRWLGLVAHKVVLYCNHYEYTTSLNYYLVNEVTPRFNVFQIINFIILFPLALTGIVFSARSWNTLLPLYSFLLVYLASNVFILVSSEYRFAVMPVFFIFAAVALAALLENLFSLSWKKILPAAFLVFLSAMVVTLDVVPAQTRNRHLSLGYNNLAGKYRNLKNYGEAARWYKKAMELSSGTDNYAWHASNYSKMLLLSGNKTAALETIEEAYSINSANIDLLTAYASILTANGSYAKAIEMQKRVLQTAPDNVEYLVNLAITYLWAGKDAEADMVLSLAGRVSPQSASGFPGLKERIKRKRGSGRTR
jgi:4-amino-4-deoxy-L-arabinose transferase-like glycosyltransferase